MCRPPGFTCTPQVGPIGTLPWYFEEGLTSGGDPAVTFGPQPGPDGTFDWANGSRLYYANLTANFSAERDEQTFKGFEAIGVSRIDGQPALTPAIVADKNAWMRPVIASSSPRRPSPTRSRSGSTTPPPATTSATSISAMPRSAATSGAAGGRHSRRRRRQLGQQAGLARPQRRPRHFGQSGCTVRTDSQGVVYVFYEEFQSPSVGLPPAATHFLVKSVDGGVSWTRPILVQRVTDPCFFVDLVIARCVMDGIAGARSDLAAAPSADIANGAPTGADATDQIVLTWVDGRDGLNDEHVMVSYSTNQGAGFGPGGGGGECSERPWLLLGAPPVA